MAATTIIGGWRDRWDGTTTIGGEIAEVGGNGSLVKAATTTIGGRQWKINVVIAGTKQEIILNTPNKSGLLGMRKRSIV